MELRSGRRRIHLIDRVDRARTRVGLVAETARLEGQRQD